MALRRPKKLARPTGASSVTRLGPGMETMELTFTPDGGWEDARAAAVAARSHAVLPPRWVISWEVGPGATVDRGLKLAKLHCVGVDKNGGPGDTREHFVVAPREGILTELLVPTGGEVAPPTPLQSGTAAAAGDAGAAAATDDAAAAAAAAVPIGRLSFCGHPELHGSLCTSCGRKVLPPAANGNEGQDGEFGGGGGAGGSREESGDVVGDTHQVLMKGGKMMSVTAEGRRLMHMNKSGKLLNSKKLSLVLDLDNTLLHCSDQPDAGRVVVDGVDGVHALRLPNHPRDYYIKLRPGLRSFLAQAATMFEMTIYTAGTSQYADAVASVLDPDRSLFQGRHFSTCFTPDLGRNTKSLERIFPNGLDMALIVDDRDDVWRGEQAKNLLLVRPYKFFVGQRSVPGGPTHDAGPQPPSPSPLPPKPGLPPPPARRGLGGREGEGGFEDSAAELEANGRDSDDVGSHCTAENGTDRAKDAEGDEGGEGEGGKQTAVVSRPRRSGGVSEEGPNAGIGGAPGGGGSKPSAEQRSGDSSGEVEAAASVPAAAAAAAAEEGVTPDQRQEVEQKQQGDGESKVSPSPGTASSKVGIAKTSPFPSPSSSTPAPEEASLEKGLALSLEEKRRCNGTAEGRQGSGGAAADDVGGAGAAAAATATERAGAGDAEEPAVIDLTDEDGGGGASSNAAAVAPATTGVAPAHGRSVGDADIKATTGNAAKDPGGGSGGSNSSVDEGSRESGSTVGGEGAASSKSTGKGGKEEGSRTPPLQRREMLAPPATPPKPKVATAAVAVKAEQENDPQLECTFKTLEAVHGAFYAPENSGHGQRRAAADFLAKVRLRVLRGVRMVFSGVIPVSGAPADPRTHRLWRMAESHGATVDSSIGPHTTHVVAARLGTAKTKAGLRMPGVFVVHLDWLMNSVWHCRRERETMFLLAGQICGGEPPPLPAPLPLQTLHPSPSSSSSSESRPSKPGVDSAASDHLAGRAADPRSGGGYPSEQGARAEVEGSRTKSLGRRAGQAMGHGSAAGSARASESGNGAWGPVYGKNRRKRRRGPDEDGGGVDDDDIGGSGGAAAAAAGDKGLSMRNSGVWGVRSGPADGDSGRHTRLDSSVGSGANSGGGSGSGDEGSGSGSSVGSDLDGLVDELESSL